MRERFTVKLTEDERLRLQDLARTGVAPARKPLHARILLNADQSGAGPGWPDACIGAAPTVSRATGARP